MGFFQDLSALCCAEIQDAVDLSDIDRAADVLGNLASVLGYSIAVISFGDQAQSARYAAECDEIRAEETASVGQSLRDHYGRKSSGADVMRPAAFAPKGGR